MLSPHFLSRDPHQLLREVDASIRVKDIQEWQDLRDILMIKWWEPILLILLFISGIGIIVTLFKLVPNSNVLLHRFIVGWCALWILTLVSCIEFLLHKFRALRRMREISDRALHQLQAEINQLRHDLETLRIEQGGEHADS